MKDNSNEIIIRKYFTLLRAIKSSLLLYVYLKELLGIDKTDRSITIFYLYMRAVYTIE